MSTGNETLDNPQTELPSAAIRKLKRVKSMVMLFGIVVSLWVIHADGLHHLSKLLFTRAYQSNVYFVTQNSLLAAVPIIALGIYLAGQFSRLIIPLLAGLYGKAWLERNHPRIVLTSHEGFRTKLIFTLSGSIMACALGILLLTMPYTQGLRAIDPEFGMRLDAFEKRLNKHGINVVVFNGYRSFKSQDFLYSLGRNQSGDKVTNARGGYSWHNFGLAMDYKFEVDGEETWDGPWDKFGSIARECGLEWGGDWKTFLDRTHVQWTKGTSLAMMRACRRMYDAAIIMLEMALAVFAAGIIGLLVDICHRRYKQKTPGIKPRNAGIRIRSLIFRICVVVSILALIPFVNSYMRVSDYGLATHRIWGLREEFHDWGQLRRIEKTQLSSTVLDRLGCSIYRYTVYFRDDTCWRCLGFNGSIPAMDKALRYVASRSDLDVEINSAN